MDESERLQRYKRESDDRDDRVFSERIFSLLNHPKLDKHCMVDAYYYDFSGIPVEIQQKLHIWRDCYLIFGITTEGTIISRWVDRWDLDSKDPIVNGIVMHKERDRLTETPIAPEINTCFDPKLLSTPAPDFIKLFRIKRNEPMV